MSKATVKNILLMSLVFFLLLYLRRYEQLLYPQVWNEDGTQNFISYIKYGWANIFEPVSGYLILLPKIITNLSLEISAIYYPEISTYLAWIFTIIVALSVAFSPTYLRFPIFAALSIFLIPTNAEVFGIPLYTFWFSSILLFLVLLWQEDKQKLLKYSFLIIGGLSSALIIVLVPLQLLRTIWLKYKKDELITFFIILVLASIQLMFIVSTKAKSHMPQVDFEFIQLVIIKFFAYYCVGDFIVNKVVLFAVGVLLLVLIFVYIYYHKKDIYFYLLVFLLFSTIALSVVRLDISTINPMHGGPRYFFFPYILLSWILLYMLAWNRWYKMIISLILGLSIILSIQHFSRQHDTLDWKRELYTCSQSSGKYRIPIQYDGNVNSTWHIVLQSEQCKKMINTDMFSMPKNIKSIPEEIQKIPMSDYKNKYNIRMNNQLFHHQSEAILSISQANAQLTLEGCVTERKRDKIPKAVLITIDGTEKIVYLSRHNLSNAIVCDEKASSVGYFSTAVDVLPFKEGVHTLKIKTVSSNYDSIYETLAVEIHKKNEVNTVALPIISKKLKGWIEKFEMLKDKIIIEGWYAQKGKPLLSKKLFLDIDGKMYLAGYGYERKGVAKVLNNKAYTYSGFKLILDASSLIEGKHHVKVLVVADNLDTLYEDTNSYEFTLKKKK